MKKRLFFGFLFLFLISNILAGGTHEDSTLVNLNSYTMTLQEAVSHDLLREDSPSATYSYTTSLSGASHNSNEIYISVDGVDMTLQEGIDNRALCGSIDSSYSSEIIFGHRGEEIFINIDGSIMSLQNVINDGEFCPAPPVIPPPVTSWSGTGCSACPFGTAVTSSAVCPRVTFCLFPSGYEARYVWVSYFTSFGTGCAGTFITQSWTNWFQDLNRYGYGRAVPCSSEAFATGYTYNQNWQIRKIS
jgi:hypothetical protein